MAQITEDYVSFETAKLLKEKGFKEMCDSLYGLAYMHNGKYIDEDEQYELESEGRGSEIELVEGGMVYDFWYRNDKRVKHQYSRPTLQRAMKWLRKIHNILIVVDYEWECDTTPYYFKIYRLDENGKPKQVPVKGVLYDKDDNPTEHIIGYRDWERSLKDFSSYEDTCEAAIKYCLENLI